MLKLSIAFAAGYLYAKKKQNERGRKKTVLMFKNVDQDGNSTYSY